MDKKEGTFEAEYLSFNDVPQSSLQLSSLLESVFETYVQEDGLTDTQDTNNSDQ